MPSVVTGKFEDLVAIGLTVLLSQDPNLELAARDVPVARMEEAIARHSPAVVVLNLGALREPADVMRLHRRFGATRLIVLANHPTAAACTQMLALGATACLSKETQGRDIVSAIHLASRGMHVLPRSATAGGGLEGLAAEGADLLTARESEVLELLQDGATNAVIAHRLEIGVETVRTHARNVYRKLGVGSRRELMRRARQEPVVVDAERRPLPTA